MRAAWSFWLVFADESGQGLRPPKGRTWVPKGRTPVLEVSYRGRGRISIAALICTKPGRRTRLIYRVMVYHRRAGESKGFDAAAFKTLLQAAHAQLGEPISLVWDSLPAHVCAEMRDWIAARQDWLLVYRPPAYAPDLKGGRGHLVQPTRQARQFYRLRHRRARGPDQKPTQTHAVPAGTPGWLHR
ncbi:transposase [Streptosporangium sp. NPDC004379]|uniref:transposase n=1 Tax=Streptosporangium sp. NPDC004379 TaxID=3366189 RepID=UPI0036973BF0